MASQLNTCRSSLASCAMRPTWRCSAITVRPDAAPVISAARHNTGNTGQAAANALPITATTTASRTGRRMPWRSVKRPAGKARNTCESANSASSRPTAAGL